MTAWLAERGGNPLLVGPDEESQQWVRQIADPGSFESCIARKHRHGDMDVTIELPDIDVGGRDIVIADDVISTGHTVAVAAMQLAERGARSISVLVTHALFADGATEQLRLGGVREICSTDSIPHPTNRLQLAELLAQALADPGQTAR
jgi:ribose-phosphate pyrophosphokinase